MMIFRRNTIMLCYRADEQSTILFLVLLALFKAAFLEAQPLAIILFRPGAY